MPYAYGAKIEHEFDTDHLNVWLTFRHPMDQVIKPAHDLWALTADDVPVDITASAWQDQFTILLTSDTIVSYPERVLLAYDGPSGNLQTTWGKDWEPWGPILSTDIGRKPCFVDRGDPADYDFDVNDFTTDGNWHDLDLSGIVPAKAKAVLLFVRIRNNVVGASIRFRRNGNVNDQSSNAVYTQVSNLSKGLDMVTPLDENRIIEYRASNVVFTDITANVRGWWF